jgi:hypothetical protein
VKPLAVYVDFCKQIKARVKQFFSQLKVFKPATVVSFTRTAQTQSTIYFRCILDNFVSHFPEA